MQNKRAHAGHAPTSHRGPDTRAKLANPKTNIRGMTISHSFQAVTISVCSVQEITRLRSIHNNGRPHPLTGTSLHQNAPSTSHTSFQNNLQSPAAHSQSTLHVQTPTLNLNAPPFPPNLHQAPPPPHVQNRHNNYHTNQQQIHTPPQPFNTQLPQSFNPQIPPPYFPQYPPTNSPSAHSTDSSILLALQRQWERQEKLDMEHTQMEKKTENEWRSMKTSREAE